eukprot:TRINITY_DN10596_c0_g2_i2.p1 TRINITY_DN10596_c0_g2~~TRINITY_DN10596_c0_g2_i2.p1  ORF type:complete len:424 (+),score=121.20 TRINITY_DN10596_c0_g2_i2:94-1365(+)
MDIYKEVDYFSPVGLKYQQLEWKYGCHNYYSLPVVLKRGQGVYVYDVDDKKYLDFLNGYCALNSGRSHPRLVKVAAEQMKTLTLTARAFFNDKLGPAEEYLCKISEYDKCVFMNTGVEGGETAIKFARRWGYVRKKVPANEARVLFCNGNFWGRTIAACGSSDDPDRFRNFGPFNLNFDLIDYNDAKALEKKLKEDPNICGFMLEAIQGDAGVIIPSDGYLKKVRELCTKYNVLMICDEVQTGIGRTGKFFCYEWSGIKPDIVILEKGLSGGILPVSAVLANNEVMDNIHPGEHGSTFGGSLLASVVALEAVKVIEDEKLVENSLKMGELFHKLLKEIKSPHIKAIRSCGLLMGIDLDRGGWQVCLNMLKNGLLTNITHANTIRFSPPLIINQSQIEDAVKIIAKSLEELEEQIKSGTVTADH